MAHPGQDHTRQQQQKGLSNSIMSPVQGDCCPRHITQCQESQHDKMTKCQWSQHDKASATSEIMYCATCRSLKLVLYCWKSRHAKHSWYCTAPPPPQPAGKCFSASLVARAVTSSRDTKQVALTGNSLIRCLEGRECVSCTCLAMSPTASSGEGQPEAAGPAQHTAHPHSKQHHHRPVRNDCYSCSACTTGLSGMTVIHAVHAPPACQE
jgi:hypothetical protein